MEPKWLEWAKQLQSIAQAGLAYSKDVYDIERIQAIRDISVDIMVQYTEIASFGYHLSPSLIRHSDFVKSLVVIINI